MGFLHSTTTLVETAMLTTPTSTTFSGIGVNEDGTAYVNNKARVGTGIVASSAITTLPTIQDWDHQRVINNVQSEMAIIEVASEEDLRLGVAELDKMLDAASLLDERGTDTISESGYAKKPYTKQL